MKRGTQNRSRYQTFRADRSELSPQTGATGSLGLGPRGGLRRSQGPNLPDRRGHTFRLVPPLLPWRSREASTERPAPPPEPGSPAPVQSRRQAGAPAAPNPSPESLLDPSGESAA